jgi:hypothetical protein
VPAYLVTRPMEIPVKSSHAHQSIEKGLRRDEREFIAAKVEHSLILLVVESR